MKKLQKALEECKTKTCLSVAKKYGYTYNYLKNQKQKHGVQRVNFRYTEKEDLILLEAMQMRRKYGWKKIAKDLKVSMSSVVSRANYLIRRHDRIEAAKKRVRTQYPKK